MRKRKYEHITATLRDDIYGLPIRQRITYKLRVPLFTSVYGAAPSKLTAKCMFRLLPALAVVVFVRWDACWLLHSSNNEDH